jgi:Family of unknown function (DUF6998)
MSANIRQLLFDYARILDELRQTEIIRSKNNPVGDYAEWLVSETFRLKLCSKSMKGHDAYDDRYKYEVKARRLTGDNSSRRLSAIRDLDKHHFDYLIGVLFDHDFGIVRSAKIPWAVVKENSSHNEHSNSAIFNLSDSIWNISGVEDITTQIQKTESNL